MGSINYSGYVIYNQNMYYSGYSIVGGELEFSSQIKDAFQFDTLERAQRRCSELSGHSVQPWTVLKVEAEFKYETVSK